MNEPFREMEEIFEPRPSTSSEDIQLTREKARPRGDSTPGNWISEPIERPNVGPRKLSIIPRTTQYEKHPLQERTESGLSQLEELTNMLHRQKTMDKAESTLHHDPNRITPNSTIKSEVKSDSSSSLKKKGSAGNNIKSKLSPSTEQPSNKQKNNKSNTKGENPAPVHATLRRLEPRGPIVERHPLLEKSESGMSELEMYLFEKEQEMLLRSRVKEETVQTNFSSGRRWSQLQPRTNQYEKHALLESRDEKGFSPLDYFLSEKERSVMESMVVHGAVIDQEEDSTGSKGKCSERCVCKNATCGICKPNHPSSSPLIGVHQSKQPLSPTQQLDNDKIDDSCIDCGGGGDNHKGNNIEDIKTPLISHENDEVIDLRHSQSPCKNDSVVIHGREVSEKEISNANHVFTDAELVDNRQIENEINIKCHGGGIENNIVDGEYTSSEYDDIMGGHPPLMKKESSRETMIEPKETNKRVHFERTLSDKERERICQLGDSQGQPLLNQDNKTNSTKNGGNAQNSSTKRRFWPWCGGNSNSSSQSCHSEQPPATELNPSSGDTEGRTTETIPLVEDTANTQHSNNKDRNENNKKSIHRKKACVIL